jgi:pimeloyl-ACP methyl ester carboxylesterase
VYQPSPLHFVELGEGVPIVLLHPGPGLDGSVFLPGVERLAAAGHRVILPDLPGNGRSPAGAWTLAGQAAAVQALAEALELRDWTLYGHSFGGHVAAQHLVSFPDAAARWILACTDVDEEGPVEFDPFFGLPEDVAARVRVAFAHEKTVQTPEECHAVWLDQLPLFSDMDISEMLGDVVFQPEAHHLRDWGDLHALPALAATTKPVLAIGGTHDRPFPPPFAQRIADTAPQGELLLVNGGHFPFAERPEAYWTAVAEWLSRTN